MVYKSSVLRQLPAMRLMPELLHQVVQSVRRLKHNNLCLIYVPYLWVF